MLVVNACCECVCVFVCACVCVCVRARKRVYLKRVVVITVKLKSYWKLFSFFVGAMSNSGWGINMEWTKKVKVRFILKGHLSGQLLSWPTP